jgi:hypothetical protein
MRGNLTPELAQKVPLSRNPFIRHVQVSNLLADPAMVGQEFQVTLNGRLVTEGDGSGDRVAIIRSSLMGRRALIEVAMSIQTISE